MHTNLKKDLKNPHKQFIIVKDCCYQAKQRLLYTSLAEKYKCTLYLIQVNLPKELCSHFFKLR